MSTDEKLLLILKKIHKKTEDGDLNWEETAEEGSYQTAFVDYIVSISEQPGDDYYLAILDQQGNLLESTSDIQLTSQFPEADAFHLMKSLHSLARRRALAIDQNLDRLLRELQ